MGRNVAWQDKTTAWGTDSLRTPPIIVSSRKMLPHKAARETLREKKKKKKKKAAQKGMDRTNMSR